MQKWIKDLRRARSPWLWFVTVILAGIKVPCEIESNIPDKNSKIGRKFYYLEKLNSKIGRKTYYTLKNWIQKMEGNSTTPKNCVLTNFLHERSTIFFLVFSLVWFWILLRNVGYLLYKKPSYGRTVVRQ